MRIKVTGQKRLKVVGKDIPKAANGLNYDPPAEPTTPGNFYVYGPNGEITQEKDQFGNLVKDFTKRKATVNIGATENITKEQYEAPIGGGSPTSNAATQSSPTPSAGNPWVNLGTNISNAQQEDARRTDGLLNPGTYNPFDVKWGQERVNPEIDITGPMSHKPLDRFGTSSMDGKLYPTRESSITGGAGMLDTKNLVTPYTGPINNEPAKTTKKPKSYREYNSAIPSMLTAGMAMTNDLLKNTLNYNDDVEYAKKLGQTNASEPTVRNVYSRGRNVMNAPLGADYAPNMMTPVQFQGRPVSEFQGFPGYGRNIAYNKNGGLYKAAEGTAFTESLGMPTLVENPNDYLRNDVPDMKGPELPAYERPQAQPTEASPAPMEVEGSSETASAFAMPLKTIKITSGFGHRDAPIKGASSNHNGIDLAAPVNTPIYAPMDGVIEKIYFNDKGGKQLIVRHSDGSRSGFAHLNDYDVSIGEKISRGQRIALSGNTGNSSGPHLHFTFKNPEGVFVDPSDFFNMGAKNKPMKGISNMDHNNPGNIHIGGFAQGYGATAGRKDAGGKVAIFPDMQTGMNAMEDLIFGNAYNNLTISQARNKWVNGSSNVSTTSTNSIVSAMGGDYRLNQLSGPQRKKLMSEFIKWEDRGVYNNLKSKGLIFKEGGEYELDDNEINYILANGGQVEYL